MRYNTIFFLVASLANRWLYSFFVLSQQRKWCLCYIYKNYFFIFEYFCTSVSSVVFDEHRRKIYSWLHFFFKIFKL